jgi:hypothetical protein
MQRAVEELRAMPKAGVITVAVKQHAEKRLLANFTEG